MCSRQTIASVQLQRNYSFTSPWPPLRGCNRIITVWRRRHQTDNIRQHSNVICVATAAISNGDGKIMSLAHPRSPFPVRQSSLAALGPDRLHDVTALLLPCPPGCTPGRSGDWFIPIHDGSRSTTVGTQVCLHPIRVCYREFTNSCAQFVQMIGKEAFWVRSFRWACIQAQIHWIQK